MEIEFCIFDFASFFGKIQSEVYHFELLLFATVLVISTYELFVNDN